MAPRLPSRSWAHLQRNIRLQQSANLPLCSRATANLPSSAYSSSSASIRFITTTARRSVRYGWENTTPNRRAADPRRYDAQCEGLPALLTGPAAALARKHDTIPLRSGVIAVKKGMTSFYTRKGTRIPCTVLQLDSVQVVGAKRFDKHGYWAVQVGSGTKRAATVPAPQLGFYEGKGMAPKEHLSEFKVRGAEGLLPVGVQLQPDWFHTGQWVDVRSNSRGMGFAGGMKRHGFAGQEKSHGNSKNHRTIGSVGPSQGSGSRVLPGKKMPGRMGNERVTVQNLAVLKVDNEEGIVIVKGAVAGPKGCMVKISDAIKKPDPKQAFVEKSTQTVLDRHPHAAELLQAAREKHVELKKMRRDKTLVEFLMDPDSFRGEAARPSSSTRA